MPTATSVKPMPKSADAFRTISEVADWLEIQAHVLRFWESKFTQVKPIKRAGGRRYYRPADMLLLGGIKRLLHDDGLTIKGVQKILREEGMSHVAALSAPLDELTQADLNQSDQNTIDMSDSAPQDQTLGLKDPVVESVVLPFEAARPDKTPEEAPKETQADLGSDPKSAPIETAAENTADTVPGLLPAAPSQTPDTQPGPPEVAQADLASSAPEDAPEPADEPAIEPAPAAVDKPSDSAAATPTPQPPSDSDTPASSTLGQDEGAAEITPDTTADASKMPTDAETAQTDTSADQSLSEAAADSPTFLRRPAAEPDSPPAPVPQAKSEPAPQAPTPAVERKPRIIELPPIPDEADMPAAPGGLAAILTCTELSPETAQKIAPVLAQLQALRNSMTSEQNPRAKD